MTHVGKQLGEYTLTQQIGSGGVAEVWMAERTRMGMRKTVAIKLLNARARKNPDNRQMFLDEARLSMLLSHSGIVSVFDADECQGECFMAMEWIDGINLAQLCAALWETGAKLPLHVSTYIIGELLRALDYGHTFQNEGAASIVHRDVSPQNVMISTSGEIKLMDFGVARFATEETQGLYVKGKLRYMPPEQLRGESSDPRVDLFAVGAIFHELIVGHRFRNTENHVELIAMIEAGRVPPVPPALGVPAAIQDVLYGLLEPDPSRRIPDARAALRMLNQWRGYENASLELEDYVHRFKRLCHERSPGDRPAPPRLHAPHRPRPARSRSAQRRAWYPQSRLNLIVAPILAVLAMTIGVSSIARALAGSRPTPPPSATGSWLSATELVAPPQVGKPEPEPEPQPQPQKAASNARPAPKQVAPPPTPPPPAPALSEVREPEPEPEPEPDPAVDPEPEPEPEPEKATVERVKIEVVAGGFIAAQVKIGGRRLMAQPIKRTRIPVGTYRVSVRTQSDQPWKRLGRIKLGSGHNYKLTLIKPGSLTLEKK